MNHQTRTEEPSYSLKTLQALLDGATYGSADAHGTVSLLLADAIGCTRASLIFVNQTGLYVRLEDGSLYNEVPPSCVLHAEVI
jgi:hypothetical protein